MKTRIRMSAVLVPLALIVSGSVQAQGNGIPGRVDALEALTASLQQQITATQAVNSTQSSQISELQNQVAALQSALAGISVTEAHTGNQVLPANAYQRLATLTLPAGNYAFFGRIQGRPDNGMTSAIGVGCEVVAESSVIASSSATLVSYYFEITPIGTLALPFGGTVLVQCRTDKAASVVIDSSDLFAARFRL